MKIFITGSTGFIGTHVAELLSQSEHETRCLVRKTSDTEKLKELGGKLVVGDVTDKASVLEGMRGCDQVINLANHYTLWEPNKNTYRDINVKGTQNVLEACLETGVSKVVHVSSVAIYGKPKDVPFTEESEIGPVRFSEYGETKYQGDLIAWELFEKKGLPLVMVYPAAVYGPHDPNVTGSFMKRTLARKLPALMCLDGPYTIVHVKDVALAIVRALEKEDNIGEKYIIGKMWEEALTTRKLYQTISEVSGVPLPKLELPNALAFFNATMLTWLANVTKRPPLWDLSLDVVRILRAGIAADGSKAERELGITYTPARTTIKDAVESFMK